MKSETFFDEKVTIYRGDCLKVIPRLGKFNAAIFDPPYEEIIHKAKSRRRIVRTDGRRISAPLEFASVGKLRRAVTPLLVDNCTGWLLAFCTPEGIAPWRDAIEDAGACYKRACFWVKSDAAPQFNGQGPSFAVEPLVTAWCGRGVSRWNGGGGKNYWIFPTSPPERQGDHPTEKPIALMIKLLTLFTRPGDVVCDPFMGSGTTMLACLATGRIGIGIEKDLKYYKLARARIEAAYMGPEESRRHIIKWTDRMADPGPLFGGS